MSSEQSKYTGQLVSSVKNSSQSLIDFQKHYPSCEFLHKLAEHFYIFWEIMLIPMFFLIGVWGGENREYAAVKFFLYTFFGSILFVCA